MKRKVWIALLCALALCWLCGAALGESKTEYCQQIGASLDALQIALASQDKNAANSALAQVRSSVYAAARYLDQIGEYDARAMEILSNANAAYNAVFGGDGNYASYMGQAREYNTQVFGTQSQQDSYDHMHVHRFSTWSIITPATCTSAGIASGICDLGMHIWGTSAYGDQIDYPEGQESDPCYQTITWEIDIDPDNHTGGTAIQGENTICLGCGAVLSLSATSAPTFGTPDFTLPAALATVEEEAFEGIAVSVVDVPESCTSIGDRAFRNCPNLSQIRIPANCSLGTDVFEGCTMVYVYGTAGSAAESYCNNPAHGNCVFVPVE